MAAVAVTAGGGGGGAGGGGGGGGRGGGGRRRRRLTSLLRERRFKMTNRNRGASPRFTTKSGPSTSCRCHLCVAVSNMYMVTWLAEPNTSTIWVVGR